MTKAILIIRENDEFSRILAENGFEIENLPLIETKPLDDLREFEKRLNEIEIYDGIFITSQNAARIFADKLNESSSEFGGKVYVLGRKSFEILENKNLGLIFDETANTAHEMLEKVSWANLENKKFLFIRGEKSLRYIAEYLSDFSDIDETIVYETLEIKVRIDKTKELREKFAKNEYVATCFFSPSAAESFLTQFGEDVLHQTVIATIGKTTAEFFERQNLNVDFVSSKSNAENFAVELIDYLKDG